MDRRAARVRTVAIVAAIAALAITPTAAAAHNPPKQNLTGPAFGLATARDGSLLVADSGAGIVRIRKGAGSLVTALPGVTDVSPSPAGHGRLFAITGAGDDATGQPASAWGFYTVRGGKAKMVANLLDFEKANNPDGNLAPDGIDSNPFDVEAISATRAVVADAGGNDLLIVDKWGHVDWIAALPQELVSTDNIKAVLGCPTPPPLPPELAGVCSLPPMIPAQPVATSVAIGPNGDYYVGELKGFPAPTGMSRIWKIKHGTRHAMCGTDGETRCKVVADGFTSIVDLELGRNGKMYVTELDEASWAAVELGGTPKGGTVNACSIWSWHCHVVKGGLTQPMATTVGKHGGLYVLKDALLPTVKVTRIR